MKKTIIFRLNQETKLPKKVIDEAPSTGKFDDYAEYLLETFDVECTLSDSIAYLKGVGAWTLDEMQDLETNKGRILWLACLECKDENTTYFYMGS